MDTATQRTRGRKSGSGKKNMDTLATRGVNTTMRNFFVIVLLFGLGACSAQSDKTMRNDEQQLGRPSAEGQLRIAPGRCRIVGTIASIDSAMEASGPCSKAPCKALVEVDSILGYGSAFGNPIALHGRIEVHFAFTLAPTTKDLFPNMSASLPGLSVGSKFQTDLESRIEMQPSGGRTAYLVYDYRKIK